MMRVEADDPIIPTHANPPQKGGHFYMNRGRTLAPEAEHLPDANVVTSTNHVNFHGRSYIEMRILFYVCLMYNPTNSSALT